MKKCKICAPPRHVLVGDKKRAYEQRLFANGWRRLNTVVLLNNFRLHFTKKNWLCTMDPLGNVKFSRLRHGRLRKLR